MSRKPNIDNQEILDRAMHVFWERGYKNTSVEDLIEKAGVNRFNLYEIFGGKHGLYLTALDHYSDQVVMPRMRDIKKNHNALTGICEYFEKLYHFLLESEGVKTCLMLNSQIELVPEDEKITSKVNNHFKKMEETFYAALSRAKRQDQVITDINIRDTARFLTGSAQGMCVMSKGENADTFLSSYVKTINDFIKYNIKKKE